MYTSMLKLLFRSQLTHFQKNMFYELSIYITINGSYEGVCVFIQKNKITYFMTNPLNIILAILV